MTDQTAAHVFSAAEKTASLWRVGARAVFSLGLAALLLRLLQMRVETLPLEEVLAAFRSVTPPQWLLALTLTAISYHAVGHYDAVLHRHLATGSPPAAARRAGIAAIALGQVLGLGLLTGALIRWRMLPDATLWSASRLSVAVALSFLGGWALVTALALLFLGDAAYRLPAAATAGLGMLLIVVSMAAPRLRFRGRQVNWPNGFSLGQMVILTAVDTLAAAGAFLALCPPAAQPDVAVVLPAFLLALGAGLVSGTPGGVGAFEVTLLALLPEASAPPLLGAVLAWRAVYHGLPAILGAALVAAGPGRSPGAPLPSPSPPCHLPAETALLHQGELSLLVEGDISWLTGKTPHALVGLLDPGLGTAGPSAAIAALRRGARRSGRIPCLYKCGARMAAAARSDGFHVALLAREAILVPRQFRLDTPARAGLRRKLRKAGASVRISCGGPLPLDRMRDVATDWAEAHGGERGFSMGRWCPDYVVRQRVYLAWAGDRLVAFVTFHDGPGRTGDGDWTLDLMRHARGAPDGTMHALIVAAVTDAARMSIGRLSLAAVPAQPAAPYRLRRFLNRLSRIDGSGLERFKTAFGPDWRPLYIAAPSRAALVLAGAEIARAIHRPQPIGPPPRSGSRSS